jgi:hypothetical protein
MCGQPDMRTEPGLQAGWCLKFANAGNEVSVSLKCCSELIILCVTTGAFLVEWMRPETTGLDINALKPLRRLSRAFPETGKTK